MKNFIIEKIVRIKFLHYVKPTNAKGLVKKVYAKANSEFGAVADPILLHSADEELLERYYSLGRETLLVKKFASRIEKDTVATIVSHQNICQYCVDAHAVSVGAENDTELMNALRENRFDQLKTHPLNELIEWVNDGRFGEGLQQSNDAKITEYLAVYFFFHYTNRLVNIFVDGSQFPAGKLRALFYWLGSKFLKKYTGKQLKPDMYSDLESEKSVDFIWSNASPVIKGRLVRMKDWLDDSITHILPKEAKNKMIEFVNDWDGQPMKIGRSWVYEQIKDQDEDLQKLTRFSYLTMFGANMIEKRDIEELQKVLGDKKLLQLSSWSAFVISNKLATIKSKTMVTYEKVF